MTKVFNILLFLFVLFNLNAQIQINGNMYISGNRNATGSQDSVYIGSNTIIGFDTLYIGNANDIGQSPYLKADANVQLYARGGVSVYGEPNKIIMDPTTSLNLYNTTGNNKTYVVNVGDGISFIQNLNFIDTLDNISNVYLASSEPQIRVENQFRFSQKWVQTVTLKPLLDGKPLDLYVVAGKMSGQGKSYIVTLDQATTLSQDVSATGQTFFVGSGINMDSFFSPIKIIPTEGTGVVKVASLAYKPKYGFLQGGEREEYVNNFWYIEAPTITKATLGLQHNPLLEVEPFSTPEAYYYYPDDTATIIRYVGSFPNTVGKETSYSNWETISWSEKQNTTQIADFYNNPGEMIFAETNAKYMQRSDIPDFNTLTYFAKVRYADDKAPLTGNDNFGRDLSGNTGHLLVPDYLSVIPQITGGSQITLTFKVKNEYRLYEYELYRTDLNNPSFDGTSTFPLIKIGTIQADSKTNFDSGQAVHTYVYVDTIANATSSTPIYYQIRPIGGTGRSARVSEPSSAGVNTSKKLTALGNPVSKAQGAIRYRFVAGDIEYASVRVVVVNSAGNVVGIENIDPALAKFYESSAISTRNFAAGVYLLVAQATREDGKVDLYTVRVIVE